MENLKEYSEGMLQQYDRRRLCVLGQAEEAGF